MPEPGSASARAAAQLARLLNESPPGPGRRAAPPPRVTAAGPASDVRAQVRDPRPPPLETAMGLALCSQAVLLCVAISRAPLELQGAAPDKVSRISPFWAPNQ